MGAVLDDGDARAGEHGVYAALVVARSGETVLVDLRSAGCRDVGRAAVEQESQGAVHRGELVLGCGIV